MKGRVSLVITAMRTSDRAWAAELMANSEPWLTLGRGRADALKLLRKGRQQGFIVLSGGERGFGGGENFAHGRGSERRRFNHGMHGWHGSRHAVQCFFIRVIREIRGCLVGGLVESGPSVLRIRISSWPATT